MKTVAVLGANGFIGTRLVEALHLGNLANVRPVLRTASSMARLSRFSLDCRVSDALDQRALAAAFAGCDVVVHSISGTPDVIVGGVAPAYKAANEAGVRRLIYLSSASVHGQSPAPGTTEDSHVSDTQPLAYNNAKTAAEKALRSLRREGKVEIVILRPGIVVGPRSFWVGSFADALLANEAFLVDGGTGICNCIYVDNLVHAIQLAMTADLVDGQSFLLGEPERVTWFDFYRPIVEALGFRMEDLPVVPPVFEERPNSLQRLRSSHAAKAVFSLFPGRVRTSVSAGWSALRTRPPADRSPWQRRVHAAPRPSLEMSLLQSCQWKLPYGKAERLLGYKPSLSFVDGVRRTIGWMEFAGYPVRNRVNAVSHVVRGEEGEPRFTTPGN